MPSAGPWLPLDRFFDPTVPKLHKLKLAARAGFEVPPTFWAEAATLEGGKVGSLLDELPDAPCIVRSGSPTEDTTITSNAGQLLSLVVESPEDFVGAVDQVVAALPRLGGRPLGVVFVQPLVVAEVAGVSFFDGFYYEETSALGSNAGLTSGRDRGQVRRGHVQRGDVQDAWLVRLHRLFGGRIDVEWARRFGALEPVLLQVRPALFPIRRNPTISLANHKEILGDPPSPWMVGLLAEVARPVMGFFEAVDPEVALWEEPYSIERGGRAWMNFGAFFRLMDHWGLPRSMVTDGVGGQSTGPLDHRIDGRRIIRNLPTLLRKAAGDYAAMFAIRRGFKILEADLEAARTLADLWSVNVQALSFSIRTNFAVNSLLAIVARVRKKLGLAQAGRVVTHEMMAAYAELASRPALIDRQRGLDAWLIDYGHRGPLESDPARPRFLELRETLLASLAQGPASPPKPRARPSLILGAIARFFFIYDEVREWFRDRLMRWWMTLRTRILEQARSAVDQGFLDHPEDVFWLRGDDLTANPTTWRDRVVAGRSAWEAAKLLELPDTGSLDEVEARVLADRAQPVDSDHHFSGIGLGSRSVTGTAVRASDLESLLGRREWPESLVAPTLEPSWAVVFSRFAGVVVDLGGELSHASILLREAEIPTVVNARGAYRAIFEGDQVTVDPVRGEVGSIVEPSRLLTAADQGRAFGGDVHLGIEGNLPRR